jgi:hypothetical protein
VNARGARIAEALNGAWRQQPGACGLAPRDFKLYIESGTAPLGWWRLRGSPLASTPEAAELKETYRLSAVWAVLHQEALAKVVASCRAAGIEVIAVKGWTIARQYCEPGLRMFTDHDIVVRHRDYARVRDVISAAQRDRHCVVDLHDGFGNLDEEDEDVLFERSTVVNCVGTPVRTLSPEDHVRLLCRHLLGHGAARPLWLCDVAVAVETRRAGFDWNRCFSSNARVKQWIACTLGLGHHLLGMSLDGVPLRNRDVRLPDWTVPTVLDAWGRGYKSLMRVADSLARPAAAIGEAPRHWPNGLQATVAVRGRMNDVPRLPFQVAACVPGAMRVMRDTLRLWHRR